MVDDGQNILVTNENRIEFVDLYTQHYCNTSIKRHFPSFRRGFHRICGGIALSMCRPEELELLICGNMMSELDFKDLEKGAQYDDGYHPDHIVIR